MADRDLSDDELQRVAELFNTFEPGPALYWARRILRELIAERADVAAVRERVGELAAQRNPDDEVLVQGFWFHPADLPKILGNFMRRSDDWAREAKDAYIALMKVQRERDEAREAIGVMQTAHEAQLTRDSVYIGTAPDGSPRAVFEDIADAQAWVDEMIAARGDYRYGYVTAPVVARGELSSGCDQQERETDQGKPAKSPGDMGSPERWGWLATLDHPKCALDGEGRCLDIHCAQCGAAMGSGWGPCPKGCGRR